MVLNNCVCCGQVREAAAAGQARQEELEQLRRRNSELEAETCALTMAVAALQRQQVFYRSQQYWPMLLPLLLLLLLLLSLLLLLMMLLLC